MNLPEIGGLTPAILWYTLFGIVALGAIYIEYDKLRQIKRRRSRERAEDENTHDDTFRTQLTNDIADKVLERLEPRFSDIERKLSSDKDRLDNHETSLKEMRNANGIIKDGLKVSCEALAAVLDYNLHNGNTEQMEKARNDLQQYTNGLIGRVI